MAGTESIEVDPALLKSDCDSDYASSGYNTESTSLSSTVNEYIFENGRRYHAYYGTDKNLLPTDEAEKDRMDLHHEIMIQLLDGELHKAPLPPDVHNILDVGTGTGIWAIDMADKYPSAQVLGIDLSPLQPKWVPPNCKFEVDDAELEWTYRSDYFSFIHFRNVAQGITKWRQVLAEAYRCTKRGGYVELSESGAMLYSDDDSLAPENPARRWGELMTEAMAKSGRTAPVDGHLSERLEKAGFADIKSFAIKQPFGPWAKDKKLKKLGMMLLLQGEQGFHSYGMMAFTRMLKMDPKEADTLCRAAIAATKNKKTHAYAIHYVAYGRKPEAEE